MRLASYVVLSATCRVTAVTYILVFAMVRMIHRRGEQNEVVLEQYVPSFSLRSFFFITSSHIFFVFFLPICAHVPADLHVVPTSLRTCRS